jgi:hypothetical protein
MIDRAKKFNSRLKNNQVNNHQIQEKNDIIKPIENISNKKRDSISTENTNNNLKNKQKVKKQIIINNTNTKTELLKYVVLNDFFEQRLILNCLENLNITISEYIHKKKNNIKELEIKKKNEIERKEKEFLQIEKNLEAKMSEVLGKANNTLNNIKTLGKVSIVTNSSKKE